MTQVSDPGVDAGQPYPNSAAAVAAFDAVNAPTFLETFEDADTDGFAITGASTITNSPYDTGAVYGFNTTAGGQHFVEVFGGSSTVTLAQGVSAFGFLLSGVQLDGLTVTLDDGASQQLAVTTTAVAFSFSE